jgi:hypothetical protein
MKRLFTVFLIGFLGYFQISGIAAGHTRTEETSYHYDIDENAVLYPNPAVDYLYVRIDLLKNRFDAPDFEVRNILGNEMSIRVEEYKADTYRIPVSEFPSGYYLLTITCNDCSTTEQSNYKESYKFLKQ